MALGAAPVSGVFINEVQSSNDTTCTDENGESQDWIELYNPGDAAVDLGGWALTDKEGKPGNWWYFPKGTQIEAKDYLVVYADKTGTAGPPADDGEGDVHVVKDSLAPDDASIRGNLVAWYCADDLDSVGTSWPDRSGRNNDALFSSAKPALQGGANNHKALKFTAGTNQRISIPLRNANFGMANMKDATKEAADKAFMKVVIPKDPGAVE